MTNRIWGFIKSVLLIELLIGLSVTLRNQFRPHTTVEYPRETPNLKPRFRGIPRLRKNPETGEDLCVGCLLCEKACPDDCIKVVPEKRPDGKGKQAAKFIINYERCCFCGLCVEACPTEAITMTHLFEMSVTDREQALYTRSELLVEEDGTPRHAQPAGPLIDLDELKIADGWMRATASSGRAAYEGVGG